MSRTAAADSRGRGTAGRIPAAVAVLLAAASLLACGSPTAPSRGGASIMITGASVDSGGTSFYGHGVDVTLTLTATADLLESNRTANLYVGAGRLPFYLCLSADGAHFTSQCQAGVGLSSVLARVTGPSEPSGIVQTTHLIAFITPPAEYGTPVTAAVRFLGGDTVPSSALAVHVLPWVIHWEPAPGS